MTSAAVNRLCPSSIRPNCVRVTDTLSVSILIRTCSELRPGHRHAFGFHPDSYLLLCELEFCTTLPYAHTNRLCDSMFIRRIFLWYIVSAPGHNVLPG